MPIDPKHAAYLRQRANLYRENAAECYDLAKEESDADEASELREDGEFQAEIAQDYDTLAEKLDADQLDDARVFFREWDTNERETVLDESEETYRLLRGDDNG
jgi:hypothetical protein